MSSTPAKAVVVSFPRSGRGVLVRSICNAYAQDGYNRCAFDGAAAHRAGMVFTHDFTMDEVYPDRKLIVAVRYPLDAFASYFDMTGARDAYPDTKNEFERVVMNTWVPMWKAHINRWVLWTPRVDTSRLIVGYEQLLASPEGVLAKVQDFLGGSMDIPAALGKETIERRTTRPFRHYHDQPLVRRISEALQPELDSVIGMRPALL